MGEAAPWAEDTPNRRGLKIVGRQIAATTAGGVAGAALNKLGGSNHPYLPLATGAAASLADWYTRYKQSQDPYYWDTAARGSDNYTISPQVTEGVKMAGENMAATTAGIAAGAALNMMGGYKHPFLPVATGAAASLADWYRQGRRDRYPKTMSFAELNEELKKGKELPDSSFLYLEGLDADYVTLAKTFEKITESMKLPFVGRFVKARPADSVDEKLQRELFENTLSWAQASLKRHKVTDEQIILYSYFLLRCLTVVSDAFPSVTFERAFQFQVNQIIRRGFHALTDIFMRNYAEAHRSIILEYCGLMKDLISRHFHPPEIDKGFSGIYDLQEVKSVIDKKKVGKQFL